MEDPRLTEFANKFKHAFPTHQVAFEKGRSQLRHCWESLSEIEKQFSFNLETLFCIDPQETALPIARQISGETIIDAFCGAGGMSIALARSGKRVTTIEVQADRIEMARQNAEIYGVGDRITFIHGDSVEVLPTLQADAVYLDPLWGADYLGRGVSRFADFYPDLGTVLHLAFAVTSNVVLKIPINLDFSELERMNRSYTQLEPKRFVPVGSLSALHKQERDELDSLYLTFGERV